MAFEDFEPPTEPLPAPSKPPEIKTNPALVPVVVPPPAAHRPPPATGAFAGTIYQFTAGLRAGEVATIRDAADNVLLTYRSFASVVGIVAALLCGIVLIAGIAGALFLFAENAPVRAILALVMTLAFTGFIAMLVPRTNVTLYDDGNPALTISQRSVFPAASYVISTPNGTNLARLSKSVLSRLGRNRWTITQEDRYVGDAVEESFGGALRRKLFGKFNRRYETDVRIEYGGVPAGRIIRRPDAEGRMDVLELTGAALDRRIAVALAALILGKEP